MLPSTLEDQLANTCKTTIARGRLLGELHSPIQILAEEMSGLVCSSYT